MKSDKTYWPGPASYQSFIDPICRKKESTAAVGLQFCHQLFRIEGQIKEKFENCSPEQRKEYRLEHSQPILNAFLTWLKSKRSQAPPKSKLRDTIVYCINQWSKLTAFIKDGRLEMDNNRAERSIKPFVMNRKAWMFAQSMKVVKASAITYSMVETAKENQLNPRNYFTYLFDQSPLIDLENTEAINQLLPWSAAIPEVCHIPNKIK